MLGRVVFSCFSDVCGIFNPLDGRGDINADISGSRVIIAVKKKPFMLSELILF